jgi:hypothetical protein
MQGNYVIIKIDENDSTVYAKESVVNEVSIGNNRTVQVTNTGTVNNNDPSLKQGSIDGAEKRILIKLTSDKKLTLSKAKIRVIKKISKPYIKTPNIIKIGPELSPHMIGPSFVPTSRTWLPPQLWLPT